MAEELRKAEHLHADESGWKLFAKVDGKGNYKWFIWVFISKDIALFVLHPTRSSKVPYKVLFNIDIDDVKKIGILYHINNERIKYNQGDSLFKEYDEKLREKIDEIKSLINIEYNHPAQAAIMNSMKEHWKGLTLFVEYSEFPMDNNHAEQIIRTIALGRKNYWGNHSIWGGELTVAMFSIIQTCGLHGLSAKGYLTYYLTECAKRGSAPPEDEIEAFLPHKLSEDIREKLRINKPECPAPSS